MAGARREFLRIAGGTAALAALSGPEPFVAASGAAVGPGIRIGYQIFSWGRHFPAAWWKGAKAVGELGFRGIEGEYTIVELYEGREEEFDERMRRCGVRLAALYSTTDLERAHERYESFRKNMQAAAFCRRAGARMIVIGGTEAKGKEDELLAAWAKAANELGRATLETHGVRCGVHPHVGSLVETREEIAKVMDLTDPRHFFLAPDTGHLMAGGSDPVEVFRTYKDRIAHAHLKDYLPAATPGARGRFVVLGRGKVDFPALIRILSGTRFDGWLDVELDSALGMAPAEVAREAREYVVTKLGIQPEHAPEGPSVAAAND